MISQNSNSKTLFLATFSETDQWKVSLRNDQNFIIYLVHKEIEIAQQKIKENQKNADEISSPEELDASGIFCCKSSKLKVLIVNDVEILQSSGKPSYSFFLFVNPTSGGNQAAILTKLDVIFENIFFHLNGRWNE